MQRLTTHQTEIVKRLVDAHGDNFEVGQLLSCSHESCTIHVMMERSSNYECCAQGSKQTKLLAQAMVKDRKLNAMLLPASKLKNLVASYNKYGSSKGRHGFRVPQKRLW